MTESEEYKVVVCLDIEKLEKTVSEYIRCGYKPVGGIVINKGYIAQAVYKEQKND